MPALIDSGKERYPEGDAVLVIAMDMIEYGLDYSFSEIWHLYFFFQAAI